MLVLVLSSSLMVCNCNYIYHHSNHQVNSRQGRVATIPEKVNKGLKGSCQMKNN